ncbi:MAG TPA: hypothetical protein VHM29_02625, partial [Acidimicrobiia bacterium]|nr:hypothetical protein [Acidimicrobiia bacterium]
ARDGNLGRDSGFSHWGSDWAWLTGRRELRGHRLGRFDRPSPARNSKQEHEGEHHVAAAVNPHT